MRRRSLSGAEAQHLLIAHPSASASATATLSDDHAVHNTQLTQQGMKKLFSVFVAFYALTLLSAFFLLPHLQPTGDCIPFKNSPYEGPMWRSAHTRAARLLLSNRHAAIEVSQQIELKDSVRVNRSHSICDFGFNSIQFKTSADADALLLLRTRTAHRRTLCWLKTMNR